MPYPNQSYSWSRVSGNALVHYKDQESDRGKDFEVAECCGAIGRWLEDIKMDSILACKYAAEEDS